MVPVPVSVELCVVPLTFPALSVTTNKAVRVPVAVGSKVTDMVQLADRG